MNINSFIYGMRKFADEYGLLYEHVVSDERRGRLGEDAAYYSILPSKCDPFQDPRLIHSSTKRNEAAHLVVVTYVCCVRGILDDVKGMSQALITLGEEMEDKLSEYGLGLINLPAMDFTDRNPELSDMLLSYYMAVLAFHDMFRTHLFELNEQYKKDAFISESIAKAFGALKE